MARQPNDRRVIPEYLRKQAVNAAPNTVIEPSVGSKEDGHDNALAETINGLYKARLMHRRAPWRTKNQQPKIT